MFFFFTFYCSVAVSDTVSYHYETRSQIGVHAEPRQLLVQGCTRLSVGVREAHLFFIFYFTNTFIHFAFVP